MGEVIPVNVLIPHGTRMWKNRWLLTLMCSTRGNIGGIQLIRFVLKTRVCIILKKLLLYYFNNAAVHSSGAAVFLRACSPLLPWGCLLRGVRVLVLVPICQRGGRRLDPKPAVTAVCRDTAEIDRATTN